MNASKPEPRIFWGFIEEERNNILKGYRSSAKQNVTIFLSAVRLNVIVGGQVVSAPPPPPPPPDPLYEHVMAEGPFIGRDPRDLVGEAINWWRDYLDEIDRRAAELEAV
jgi:hypothetical protein